MSGWVLQHIKQICTVCLVIGIIAMVASVITGLKVANETHTTFIATVMSADRWARVRLYTLCASVLIVLLSISGLMQANK